MAVASFPFHDFLAFFILLEIEFESELCSFHTVADGSGQM